MSSVAVSRNSPFAPLRLKTFRAIWSASLASNFGYLILGVAAAWEMTRLTDAPEMVALVQSAIMLPLMLFSVPAGAMADMFDRRRIALCGLGFSMAAAVLLTLVAWSGALTPWLLLGLCVLIGAGVALYGPAWQSSIGEQVPAEKVPAAIALNSISYNVARSFGPAIGGAVVLAAGAQAGFAISALSFAPLFLAFALWRRKHVSARLPPERIDRAIISGARYARHAPSIRNTIVRSFVFGLVTATTTALAPLVARDLLGGDAAVFGLLLGVSGVGAVIGALFIAQISARMTNERAITVCTLIAATAIAAVGFSRNISLTCLAMFVVGAANTLTVSLLNVGVQMGAPRWVTARALSLFGAALTGGVAFGAWIWGEVSAELGVGTALVLSGAVAALTPLLGLRLPIRSADVADVELVAIEHEPEVDLAITLRSGPITVEIDYRVDPDRAREFYDVMRQIERARLRRGAYNWTLSRDIGDAQLWVERYQCPTWADYLRQVGRLTQGDCDLQIEADAFQLGTAHRRVRRLLERPFGSVRWKTDSPDTRDDAGQAANHGGTFAGAPH